MDLEEYLRRSREERNAEKSEKGGVLTGRIVGDDLEPLRPPILWK